MSRPPIATLASLGTIAALAAVPGAGEVLRRELRIGAPMTRRDRIHALHERTGWQLSVCRRHVDTLTDDEIDALVREHRAKEGSESR